MTYDQWEAAFCPRKTGHLDSSFNGTLFETYGLDLLVVHAARDKYVWTLLDNDIIVAGMHRINRVGYFITQFPWYYGTEEIFLHI